MQIKNNKSEISLGEKWQLIASSIKSHDEYDEACSTEEYFSPLNCGILGCLYNGISWKTASRVLKDPLRVITGLTLVALSSLTIHYTMTHYAFYLTVHRVVVIAGAVLAVVSSKQKNI